MPPVTKTPLQATTEDPACPYSLHWLDSCYQETLLPGAPWHRINEELCAVLAEYLPKQMSQLQRASILANILGDSFMTKYYPDVLLSLSTVPEDQTMEDKQSKLALEASSWLKNQLLKAARQVGCLPDGNQTELSENTIRFVKQTSETFFIGLNRELYRQEQATIAAVKVDRSAMQDVTSQHSFQKLPSIGERLPHHASSPPSHARSIASPAGSTASSSRATVVSSVKTERVKTLMYNLDKQPQHPSMTSKTIDLIAESVVKLLERSPRRFAAVAKRLHGRLLPTKLRMYMWTESLYKAEREKLTHGVNVERLLRERFGRTVARNVGELRLARATQSPMNRLIENCVIEIYDRVPALAACKNKSIMRDAIKALNVLYTYDRTYEPYLVLWLFPLQLAFSEQAEGGGPEYVYELAMHLDILNSSLFIQWTQVYAIADLAMHHLLKNDLELHNHLLNISQINTDVNAKDFVIEILQKERQTAHNLLQKNTSYTTVDSQQLLSDPRLYIRKWAGEGFVGVLDTPSVMFIWDQLFLQDWSSTVLQDFTLVIIILLRERFLLCGDHMSMKQVFLQEPCKLLLADIQSAWLMLHDNVPYLDISKCNRVRPFHLPIDEISLSGTSAVAEDLPNPI